MWSGILTSYQPTGFLMTSDPEIMPGDAQFASCTLLGWRSWNHTRQHMSFNKGSWNGTWQFIFTTKDSEMLSGNLPSYGGGLWNRGIPEFRKGLQEMTALRRAPKVSLKRFRHSFNLLPCCVGVQPPGVCVGTLCGSIGVPGPFPRIYNINTYAHHHHYTSPSPYPAANNFPIRP